MKRKPFETSYAIIGVGRFGSALAETLAAANYNIIVCDRDPERVRAMREITPYAYVVEHMTKTALDEIGVRNCQCAIVCIGSAMDTSILAALHLVNLGVSRVIAKANSKEQGQILEKIGAEVVYPEHDMGVRVAKRLMSAHLVDYFTLNDNTEIYEMKAPEAIIGHTVQDIDIRRNYGINIIAIEHGSQTITDIRPDYVFQPGDGLVVIGMMKNIQEFEDKD